MIEIKNTEVYKIKIENNYEFENSIFSEVYRSAKSSLIDIIEHHKIHDSKKTQYKYDSYNNIICFAGERGKGKSSSMISFLEALISKERSDQYFDDKNHVLNDIKFTTIDLIDPSLFKGKETLLEIILAKMFSKFRKLLEDRNSKITDESKRQLVDSFQTVFENLKYINDRENLYKQDALDALIKLSTSSNLKESFDNLVEKYLNVDLQTKEGFLVIAIDDFDLKIEGVYDMLEDVRRFLITKNIIILIACKVEQLKESVHAHIYSDYIKQLCCNSSILDSVFDEKDIKNKALKYIEKLIPDNRKIILPDVSELDFTRILVRKDLDIDNQNPFLDNSANGLILETIYLKTHLFIRKKNYRKSILLDATLRTLISLLSRFKKLDDQNLNDQEVINGIYDLKKYTKDFLPVLDFSDEEIEMIIECDINLLNYNTVQILKTYFSSEVNDLLKDIKNYVLLQNNDVYALFFTLNDSLLDDDLNINKFEAIKLLYNIRQFIDRLELKNHKKVDPFSLDIFNRAGLINTSLLNLRLPTEQRQEEDFKRTRDYFEFTQDNTNKAEKNIFDKIRKLDSIDKVIFTSFVPVLGQVGEKYRTNKQNIFDISLDTNVSTLHFSIFSFLVSPYNLANKLISNYSSKDYLELHKISDDWINSEFYYLFNNSDFVIEFYTEFLNSYENLSKNSRFVGLSYYDILRILFSEGLSRTFDTLNIKYTYLNLNVERYYESFKLAEAFAKHDNNVLKDIINYIYEKQKIDRRISRFRRLSPRSISEIDTIKQIDAVRILIVFLKKNVDKSFARTTLQKYTSRLDIDLKNLILETNFFNSLFKSGGNKQATSNRKKLIKDLENLVEKNG